MEEKRSIDVIRNSGGQTDVGSAEDGAIKEMIQIGRRGLILKEYSIYELMFADDIDPERTNIELPKTITKLVMKEGTESEMVARTFITATKLFKPEYYETSVDTSRLLELALELIQELAILQKEVSELGSEEQEVIKKYNENNSTTSYSIPSITNLESRCKTIFQKTDHLEQILIEITTIFYPKNGLTKQSHFPKLHEFVKSKHGENDTFIVFLEKAVPFMKVIRELRNGLDHRLESTKVKNFEIQSDSSVLTPTIELKYKDIKLERTSLSAYLKGVIISFINITESMYAYLADRNVKPSPVGYTVTEIPEEKRVNKNVRYAFYIPFGKEGFYCQ